MLKDGSERELRILSTLLTGAPDVPVEESPPSSGISPGGGETADAIVSLVGDVTAKRGQVYARLYISDGSERRATLCKGYVYTGYDLNEGEFTEPGPGGGEGFLSWVSLAASIAPVDLTRVLAAANTFRRIHGFTWYYNAAAVVATRTMTIALRHPGLAVPTGFAGVASVWVSSVVTLTTGEEGVIYVKGQEAAFDAYSDNGTITHANITTASLPFPYDAVEDDLADIIFDVGSADSADRHSIYLLQEEWLVP